MADHRQADRRASRQGEPSADNLGSADVNELARQFSEVARSLQSLDDTDDMLSEMTAAAVRVIPGATDASLTVVTGRREAHARYPTSVLPRMVDTAQTDLAEGPCLDAIYEQQTVRVADMAREQRWPTFARAATQLGAGSMLSFQLYVEGDNLGALNLYNRQPYGFDDESEQVGLLFASHAAVAFADAQKIDQLTTAIATRDLIGQAKGILMERYQMDADQAFRALTRVSQNSNRKMRDVAEELTSTRHLPGLI